MASFHARSVCCVVVLLLLVGFSDLPEKLPIGSDVPMPEMKMKGTDGEMHSIQSAAGDNGILVLFSCNTCPWVKAWESRYDEVAEAAANHGIGVLAVNSNAAYRSKGDSMAEMKAQAEEHDYPFPYVLDEKSALADAFGATKTPDVFLFNRDMRLVYRGAIDDNARNAGAVEETYLLDAITAMAHGERIEPTVTKSIGCAIKRRD